MRILHSGKSTSGSHWIPTNRRIRITDCGIRRSVTALPDTALADLGFCRQSPLATGFHACPDNCASLALGSMNRRSTEHFRSASLRGRLAAGASRFRQAAGRDRAALAQAFRAAEKMPARELERTTVYLTPSVAANTARFACQAKLGQEASLAEHRTDGQNYSSAASCAMNLAKAACR